MFDKKGIDIYQENWQQNKRPSLRGTKQSRTVQGHQLSCSAYWGLLRTSQ
jgi:hypothetical protein